MSRSPLIWSTVLPCNAAIGQPTRTALLASTLCSPRSLVDQGFGG
jgi:hypothetical protein